jgi:hypothetical protein
MGNYGYLLYGLTYGILSILTVVWSVLLLLREYGPYEIPIRLPYAVYQPIAGQGVVVKYSYGPSTSACENLTE